MPAVTRLSLRFTGWRFFSFTLVTLACAAAAAQAPVPVAASGVIAGRVIDGRTGVPIVGASVTLDPLRSARTISGDMVVVLIDTPAQATRYGVSAPQQTVTSDNGAFRFEGLLPGNFVIGAKHADYEVAAFGQRAAGDLSADVELKAGQIMDGLTVSMWKPSALGGRVANEADKPVAGVDVRALRRAPSADASGTARSRRRRRTIRASIGLTR